MACGKKNYGNDISYWQWSYQDNNEYLQMFDYQGNLDPSDDVDILSKWGLGE